MKRHLISSVSSFVATMFLGGGIVNFFRFNGGVIVLFTVMIIFFLSVEKFIFHILYSDNNQASNLVATGTKLFSSRLYVISSVSVVLLFMLISVLSINQGLKTTNANEALFIATFIMLCMLVPIFDTIKRIDRSTNSSDCYKLILLVIVFCLIFSLFAGVPDYILALLN